MIDTAEEIRAALKLLDAVTAEPGSEDALGCAELALQRVLERRPVLTIEETPNGFLVTDNTTNGPTPWRAAFNTRGEALAHVREGINAMADPFDLSKLRIERVRFSTTQGEVRVTYDGELLDQYGDQITLQEDGTWQGLPDDHWQTAARRILAERERAL